MKMESENELYMQLIKLPINSREYVECIAKIRRLETGCETFGLNLSLKRVAAKGVVEYNYSKAL